MTERYSFSISREKHPALVEWIESLKFAEFNFSRICIEALYMYTREIGDKIEPPVSIDDKLEQIHSGLLEVQHTLMEMRLGFTITGPSVEEADKQAENDLLDEFGQVDGLEVE